MQRALNETEDGRKAKDTLKKLFEQRQKTLDKQQNDLKTLKEGIEKQRDVLSRDVLAKKLEEYQKALVELQQTYMEFQRELQAKEGELTKPILERMQRIMRRIGQTEGYTLILERGEAGVVYIPSTYDLTDVLIQRYKAARARTTAKPRRRPSRRPASRRQRSPLRPPSRTSGLAGARESRHHQDSTDPPASLAVPADRPHHRARAAQVGARDQVRDLQRAVLPRPFPGRAGVPRRAVHRGDGAADVRARLCVGRDRSRRCTCSCSPASTRPSSATRSRPATRS